MKKYIKMFSTFVYNMYVMFVNVYTIDYEKTGANYFK